MYRAIASVGIFCALVGTSIYCGITQRVPSYVRGEYFYGNFTYDRYAIYMKGCGRDGWYTTPVQTQSTSQSMAADNRAAQIRTHYRSLYKQAPRLFPAKPKPRGCSTTTTYNVILKHDQYECLLWSDDKCSNTDGLGTRAWILQAHPLGTRRDQFYYIASKVCTDDMVTHIKPWAIAVIVICTILAAFVPCIIYCCQCVPKSSRVVSLQVIALSPPAAPTPPIASAPPTAVAPPVVAAPPVAFSHAVVPRVPLPVGSCATPSSILRQVVSPRQVWVEEPKPKRKVVRFAS